MTRRHDDTTKGERKSYAMTAERGRVAAAAVASAALASVALHPLRALGACAAPARDKPRAAARTRYRLPGLNFSPYTGAQDPNAGSIVSETQIVQRLQPLLGRTRAIRTFGVTRGLECVPAQARALGFEVWAGAWLSADADANEREIANLIAIGKAGHARALVVGSEVLLRGDLSPEALVDYLRRVRAAVPHAVRVATGETYAKLIEYGRVLAASDIVFFNVYPYWEGVHVEHAVAHVDGAWRRVVAAARGKPVVISEIGWPSAGTPKGAAIPSETNAARFFATFTQWARTRNTDYFWFSAADEPHKAKVEGDVGAHWGLWYADGTTLKPGMQAVFDMNA